MDRKLKILVHTHTGASMGICKRFSEEGHQVRIYVDEKTYRPGIGSFFGLFNSMSEGLSWKPDFVLFDLTGSGALADAIRRSGMPVFGAHKFADEIEDDRKKGSEFMEQNGILIPPTTDFTSLDEAIKFVEKNPKGYVMKMDDPDAPKASSYVAKDAQEIHDYLTYLKADGLVKNGSSFILQEFKKGIEVDTECIFSQGKPIPPFNNDFETKRFLPGDLGPNSGCETSVLFAHDHDNTRMVAQTMRKVFKRLEQLKWTGFLSINSIVSEEDHKPYGIEWNARMGYSSSYALAAMIRDDLGETFFRLATGDIDEIPIQNEWGTSLRASSPPYPLEFPSDKEVEKKIYSTLKNQAVKLPADKDVWILDLMKDSKGNIVNAGVNGEICECTGSARTLEKAWKKSQAIFDAVKFPNKQGRYIDGIDSAIKRINKLRSWGYDMPDPEE